MLQTMKATTPLILRKDKKRWENWKRSEKQHLWRKVKSTETNLQNSLIKRWHLAINLKYFKILEIDPLQFSYFKKEDLSSNLLLKKYKGSIKAKFASSIGVPFKMLEDEAITLQRVGGIQDLTSKEGEGCHEGKVWTTSAKCISLMQAGMDAGGGGVF